MLRLGLRLTVLLAAIAAFLALAPGHKASASGELNGHWGTVYSQTAPFVANAGDCAADYSEDTPNHYTSTPFNCQSGGASTASNGVVSATLAGLTFAGTVTFPPSAVVNFTGTVTPDYNKIENGTWNYPAGGTSGIFESVRGATTAGTNQTVSGADNSSLTFVGTGTSVTSIVAATTTGGVVPPTFQVVPANQYYHVITVPHPPSPGSGPFTFCAEYLGTTGTSDMVSGVLETTLQIAHLETGIFVAYPRFTPGTSPVANIVCGQVTSLSEFALVAPTGGPPPPLDHFKCYPVVDQNQPPPDNVILTDQFGTAQVTMGKAAEFCNPVEKQHGPTNVPRTNPDSHLTFYNLFGAQPQPLRFVDVDNQFGPQQLQVRDTAYLAAPTRKQPFGPAHDLDHFKCYFASGPQINQLVDLTDQFHVEPQVQVLAPDLLCNPVAKIHGAQNFPITNQVDHLVCYRIIGTPFNTTVNIANQFVAVGALFINPADHLCVPSLKLAVNTATPVVTPSPTPVVTDTPTPVVTDSPTPVVTESPTPVVTESPTPVVTDSPTPVVTESPTPVVTESPTPVVTDSPTPVVTESPTPVVTTSPTPVVTTSPTPVVTTSPTPVVTTSPTPVVTNSPTPVVTNSPTPVVTNSPTPVATTPHPTGTGAVGGFVDVVTGGQSGGSGLSLLALTIILMVMSTAGGGAAYAFARRRQ